MDVVSPVSGVLTIDIRRDFQFEIPLNQNVTSVVIDGLSDNGTRGKSLKLFFKQDGTGSRTVAGWPASVKLAGNALTLTTAAGKRDTVCFTRLYSEAVLVEDRRAMNAPA